MLCAGFVSGCVVLETELLETGWQANDHAAALENESVWWESEQVIAERVVQLMKACVGRFVRDLERPWGVRDAQESDQLVIALQGSEQPGTVLLDDEQLGSVLQGNEQRCDGRL